VRVGIVGGGQLGRMLALAGYPLGIHCVTLDPAPDSPASQVAPSIVGAYDDREALVRLADGVDVVTYEFENVPVESVRFLREMAPVFPPPEALEASQDRVAEKALFDDVGVPTSPHEVIATPAELHDALAGLGTPAVLKTRRLGYDGKGQVVIHDPLLAEDAWRAIGERPSILEGFVAFDRELSILGVRDRDGSTAFYPLVENHHRDGILRLSIAPAPDVTPELQSRAESYARLVMDRLGYVGVMAIELFQVGEKLVGNEMAPRVHNSGHWTIEGARTSQFENHLRAITGLPLGSTAACGASAMVNLIGAVPDTASLLAAPGAHLHLYGKEPRPGRKVGHVTLNAQDTGSLDLRVLEMGDPDFLEVRYQGRPAG
jgi:5-(carboxyamino)imidazole ribonucleotide synthase